MTTRRVPSKRSAKSSAVRPSHTDNRRTARHLPHSTGDRTVLDEAVVHKRGYRGGKQRQPNLDVPERKLEDDEQGKKAEGT